MDKKALIEAKSVLPAADGIGSRSYLQVKGKRIDTSRFPSHGTVAYNIGKSIPAKKLYFGICLRVHQFVIMCDTLLILRI